MEKNERYDYYNHLTGLNKWSFSSKKNPDKIINVSDGPSGIRRDRPISAPVTDSDENYLNYVCFPTPSAIAASFDKNVAYKVGTYLAKECLNSNTQILLAPAINIKASTLCGRNFEYFSEDSCLTGVMASNEIKGLGDYNVGACLKHYALNSKELGRRTVSAEVSKRAINDTYLKAFNYVLRNNDVAAIMTSYNKVNGEYVPESSYMMNKLRNVFKYDGLVMSDWNAVSNRPLTIHLGLDLEMPKSKYDNDYLDNGYGKVFNDEDLIRNDDRIDKVCSKYYNNEIYTLDLGKLHYKAVELANETMVLVKNEKNFLPLDDKDKLLVIGEFASAPTFVGNGSGYVTGYRKKTFLDILNEKEIDYTFLQGYDKRGLIVDYNDIKKLHYKKVLVFLGQYDEGEGKDRDNISLTESQINLISMLKKYKIKFATVVITGSVVDIKDTYEASKAMMISYFAGEGQAEAIFNNLYGIHNPCGRLPETWISDVNQNPLNTEVLRKDDYYMYYDNDIYVGYKYYDKYKTEGFMLKFGYGLSYSTFKVSDGKFDLLKDRVKVSIDVKNTSKVDGAIILQLYVRKVHSTIYRPVRELKDFNKLYLEPKEKKTMTLEVLFEDLKAYKEEIDDYALEDGLYEFMVADSLDNIYAHATIMINGVSFNYHKEPISLKRKEISSEYTIDSPIGSLFNNEYFKEYVKNKNLPIDIANFETIYKDYVNEPIRLLVSELNVNLSTQDLFDLVLNMNNSDKELNKHLNYEYLKD